MAEIKVTRFSRSITNCAPWCNAKLPIVPLAGDDRYVPLANPPAATEHVMFESDSAGKGRESHLRRGTCR